MKRSPGLKAAAVMSTLALSLTAIACGGGGDAKPAPGTGGGNGSDTGSEGGSGGTLTIGTDMANFPSLDTGAITLAGFEGQRDIGNLVYEGLTKRDVSNPNAPAGVAPALARSWQIADGGKSYTFQLRKGVKFQDGTAWDADALIFNYRRYTDNHDPHYVPQLITYYGVLQNVKTVKKLGPDAVRFTLKSRDAYFLADLYNVYFASPASLRSAGSAGQARHPVGTGPFTFSSRQGNQSLTFARNSSYWGKVPKLDRIRVLTIPDATARVAALRSGRVNWIENLPPDDIPGLKTAGFTVTQKAYDWSWSYQLLLSKKPMDDVRVRQALNYAIDRDAIANDLLSGTGVPQYQLLGSASPFYSPKDDVYHYDPAKAKALLTAAGYPNGFSTSVGYVSAGSGSMQPAAMNTAVQSQLAKVGVKLKIQPADFSTIDSQLVSGKFGWAGEQSSLSLEQPSFWNFLYQCKVNEFKYCNPKLDAVLAKAKQTVDQAARNTLLTQAASIVTHDAPWLFVVGDTAPRAMASSVKGYVQPRSWWINFNDVYVQS